MPGCASKQGVLDNTSIYILATRVVLEFAPLCNDQQTYSGGIMQQPNLPLLALSTQHGSFNKVPELTFVPTPLINLFHYLFQL